MDYRELLHENNQAVQERYELSCERIREIAVYGSHVKAPALHRYFNEMALFLSRCQATYKNQKEGLFSSMTEEDLRLENESFYQDIIPENYTASYASPAYAIEALGEEYGRILSFLYAELRTERVFAFEQDLTRMTILNELFLEIYGLFLSEDVSYRKIRDVIYWFMHDNIPLFTGWRIREMLDPGLDFAASIVMDANLSDLSYLYAYGEYISDDEREMARFLNGLDDREIEEIAAAFTGGFRRGCRIKRIDLNRKKTVNIRYHIGFERIIRAVIRNFKEIGLIPVIYRSACNSLNKVRNIRTGYQSTNPNPQYDYDHRFDEAVYFDRRIMERKLSCMRKILEEYAAEAKGYAGPAQMVVFGAEPFEPAPDPEAYYLSERQQMLSIEYSTLKAALLNRFLNQKESSFTLMACPMPSIGPDFPDIFQEVKRVNMLDQDVYREIQQRMISVLDQADYVKLMGRGKNMTNLEVRLKELTDPDRQTKFENCLADENIPLGEVFTSPVLKGTSGLLHVTEVFLGGLCFKDLRLQFEDGMVTDYSCGNFPDPEDGKRYIRENILDGHDSLPIGEFAIGTNTTAYVMASKYGIMQKLPVLISEKMGPHLAVGDTCYAYSEDVPIFNPDGREMVARDNECSAKRKEDPKLAYYNCHTDISIPYEELDRIVAGTVKPVGKNTEKLEVPILLEGRFVLEGTFALNDPFKKR